MKQSKKLGWVSILFILIFSLPPGIVTASGSTTLSFPGNGYVGVCLHTQTPDDLMQMIFAITGQTAMNHCWVTATVNRVQGVIHSDGYGAHFLCWPNFLEICEPRSIRLFKPNKKAIGYAELEGFGIDLSDTPSIFRHLIARQLGDLMINIWIQEMLAYRGVPYDWNFMPSDDELYCSELLAHGWNNSGSTIDLFPSKKAEDLVGWDSIQDLLPALGYSITGETDVYNVTYILSEEIRPYFKEISVD